MRLKEEQQLSMRRKRIPENLRTMLEQKLQSQESKPLSQPMRRKTTLTL